MSRLIANSTPAERAVGCSFAERNRSPSEVVENGGTLVGSPTFDSDGIVLDGSTQYVSYDLTGNEFNSSELSIVCEFWPDFETDEDLRRYIVDSSGPGSGRIIVRKDNNAGGNVLRIYLGSTTLIASILEATYSPFWKTNARNVLVIRSVSGNTSAELNGNVILASDTTVWTFSPINTFYLGSNNIGTENFKGKIGQFKVFKSLLTEQDAINFYDNTTYTYSQRALVDLPMQACQHDPDNVRTLDISGNGNHATFGDGVTASTYPTKLQKRGYSFDGGDYATILDGVSGSHDFTDVNICTFGVLAKATTDFSGDGSVWRAFMTVAELRSEGGAGVGKVVFNIGFDQSKCSVGRRLSGKVLSVSSPSIGQLTSIIGVSDGATLSIYVNGQFENSNVDTNDESLGDGSIKYYLGSRTTDVGLPVNFLTGVIHDHLFCPFVLTPLQIADWHFNALKRINRV